jgi:hypothetical protein
MYEILGNFYLKYVKHSIVNFDYSFLSFNNKIFVTNNFVFLHVKYEIIIYYNDLEYFRSVILSVSDDHKSSSCGIYVENNIVYVVRNCRIRIYELY